MCHPHPRPSQHAITKVKQLALSIFPFSPATLQGSDCHCVFLVTSPQESLLLAVQNMGRTQASDSSAVVPVVGVDRTCSSLDSLGGVRWGRCDRHGGVRMFPLHPYDETVASILGAVSYWLANGKWGLREHQCSVVPFLLQMVLF